MDISNAGLDLIKSFEGLHKKREDGKIQSYLCPAGVWTIGYGCTKGVNAGMVITEEQAETMFIKELAVFEDAVERLVTVSLDQSQFDALVSFTYNVGIGALTNSTLLVELNKGNYQAVPGQLMRWVKANVNGKKVTLKGLVRRRKAEADLWLENYGVEIRDENRPPETENALPQNVEPETGTVKDVVKKSGTFWAAIAALFGAMGQYITDIFNFAGDVIVETQNKLTLTETLYKLLSANVKEVFVAVAVIGAIGVVWRRIRAAKEKKEG